MSCLASVTLPVVRAMRPTRYVLLLVALPMLLAFACNETGNEAQPGPATERLAATSIPKPAPQTLLLSGFVLDQSLEISLDGSDEGQIVVISHTTTQAFFCGEQAPATPMEKTGIVCEDVTPALAPAKEQCSTSPLEEMEPSACIYRLEIFDYDPTSGWVSSYVGGMHRAGIQSGMEARTFRADGNREALVLSAGYCTGIGSGCGDVHEVLTMQDGQVIVVYGAWKAQLTLEQDFATFDNPALFRSDPLCCPSGRRIETVGWQAATGDLAVIESQLLVCTEGVLAYDPGVGFPQGIIQLACEAGHPGSAYLFISDTVVEPATVGGFENLREGDRIRVEYATDCEEGTLYCELVATKITRLGP